ARELCPLSGIESILTEHCFNVEVEKNRPLTPGQYATLLWLLRETYEPEQTSTESFLDRAAAVVAAGEGGGKGGKHTSLLEVGPRLSFESAVSSNAKSICRASGLEGVSRLEV
ncbi:unnamed protein product, partial [Choristocarpus tenellus]